MTAMAVDAVSVPLVPTVSRRGSRKSSVSAEARGLSWGQNAAVALSMTLGMALAGYGFAGSYVTVSELAARHGVPLTWLVPLGIDGGLLAVVVLDLVLTWVGTPVGWLRELVRVLSVGTVAANAVSGWADAVAVGLHVAAPLMLLAMVEAGRTVMLRRLGEVRGTRRDAIPLARWLLAPWRTCRLWRRMVLWQITSCRQAVDVELDLCRAVAQLRMQYGRRWRRRAPADLVWMLRTGVGVDEACARARALTRDEDPAAVDCVANPVAPGSVATVDSAVSTSPLTRVSAPIDDPGLGSDVTDIEDDRLVEAVRLNRQHWINTGRPISAETLRQRLRVSAGTSRDLLRAVRAKDRAAVLAGCSPTQFTPTGDEWI